MKTDPRDERPLEWPAASGAVDDVLAALDAKLRAKRARQARRRRFAGIALGLALLLGLGGIALQPAFDARPSLAVQAASPVAAVTVVAQPERRVLEDGSVVDLKPGARILTAFSASERRVVLEEGEAHFQVTKNPSRPFLVVVGGVQFRAVGTAFSVQRGQGEVELFVTEGRVAVDQSAHDISSGTQASAPAAPGLLPNAQTLAVVDAGHRVVVTSPDEPGALRTSQVVPVPAAQGAQRLAWRVPTLDLSGTPLAEALALFNQHGDVRLVLGDPELAQVRLSGMIRADNIDTLLALLEDSHGIRAEKRGDHEIVLRKRR